MGTEKSSELLPGTLDLLILKTLNRGEMHGYGIAQPVKTRMPFAVFEADPDSQPSRCRR